MANKPVTAQIAMSVANESNDFFPCVISGRTPVCLDLKLKASGKIGTDAEISIRAREIFSGKTAATRRQIDNKIKDGAGKAIPIDITPREMKLTPGCWHLLGDIEVAGKPLCGTDAGSCVVYAKKPGESTLHARASWNIAFTEFLYDRAYDIYHPYTICNDGLPPTGNPFDARNEKRFRRLYLPPNKVREEVFPEHYHDGGMGFLYAAHVYHLLGEKQRARFCEKIIRNFAEMILEKMHYGDGRLGFLFTAAGHRKKGYHCKQQDAHALKFLAQMFFHFRFGSGCDPDYAARLLERSKRIFDYQVSEPLGPGCGEHGCKVYDGRILSGLGWYCVAHKAQHGEYPGEKAKKGAYQKVLQFAADTTLHLLSNHGWYDAGCMTEGKCHIWCGNMNLLNGLLPIRRMVNELASEKIGKARYYRPHIEKGIKEAFRFLVQTNGAVTNDDAPFVPSFTGGDWAAGNLYELCDEYLDDMEEHAGVRQLLQHLTLRTDNFTTHVAGRNRHAVALLECKEYRNIKAKPPFPWRSTVKNTKT